MLTKGWARVRRMGPLSGALWLAALLMLPTLYLTVSGDLGFVADDHWHNLALSTGHTYPGGPVPRDLFRFNSGNPEDLRAAMQDGSASWFSDPYLKIAFFRPLSNVLHWLDHALFGANVLTARIHSLLWYAALLILTWRLLKRLLSKRVAALALIVFTLAAAHWQPVAWTAARNSLVSAVFATGALLAYVRARTDGESQVGGNGGNRLLGISLILYWLGSLAGESALGIVPYIIGYELLHPRRWLLQLVPWVVGPVVTMLGYAGHGFGVVRSSAYISPLSEPGHFLAELPGRVAAMLSFSYLGFPADIWLLEPELQPWSAWLGVASAAGLLALLWFVRRHLEVTERRPMIWLGLGALGAMIPQAGGMLGSRSLTLPSLGTSVIVAMAMVGLFDLAREKSARMTTRSIAGASAALLVLIHLILAPFNWLGNALFYAESMRKVSASVDGLSLGTATNRKAILLQVSDVFVYRYLFFERRASGLPTPKTWHSLSQANHAHRVRRIAADTFELEIIDGEMFETPFEKLDRPRDAVMKVGDRVDLEDFSVRVLDTGEHGPRRIAVQCKKPLEDPSWLFLVWRAGRLEEFRFPRAIGEAVVVPFSAGPTAL